MQIPKCVGDYSGRILMAVVQVLLDYLSISITCLIPLMSAIMACIWLYSYGIVYSIMI